MFSVNSNYSASLARHQYSTALTELDTARSRVGSGLKVRTAKDDGALFAIAQVQRSAHDTYGIVRKSIDRASGVIDISLAAVDAVYDILHSLRETALYALDLTLTPSQREAHNTEFVRLRDQIDSITKNAEFDGINILDGSITHFFVPDGSEDGSFVIGHYNLTLDGSFSIIDSNTDLAVDESNIRSVVHKVDNALDNVAQIAQRFGGISTNLDIQAGFLARVEAAAEAGIGNLVDADLGRESARLEALRTRQQLSAQAVSIANSAPNHILTLF